MDPEMALQARGDKEEEKVEANNVSKVRLIEKLFDWIHIGFDKRWSRGDDEEEEVEAKSGPVGGDDEGDPGGHHSKSLMQVSITRGPSRKMMC